MYLSSFKFAFAKLVIFFFLLFIISSIDSFSTNKIHPWVYHINMEQGLPGNWVRSIVEDDFGVMWFGTWNGLASWDGGKLKSYKKEDDHTSLASNMITFLKKDLNGDIYICTAASFVHVYDKESESIKRLEVANDSSIYYQTARNINFTNNHIWIGTNSGFLKYDRKSKNIELIENEQFKTTNKNQTINCTTIDGSGTIWVGTNYGIQYFDQQINNFLKKTISNKGLYTIQTKVNTFFSDQFNRIWVGADDGLYLFDNSNNEFHKISYIHPEEKTPIDFSVNSIDGMNNQIHLSTSLGLLMFDFEQARYYMLTHDITGKHAINTLNIENIHCSKSGIVWVGTYNGGVNYFKPGFNGFVHVNKASEGLCNPYILSMSEDHSGNIWVGTEDGITTFNKDLASATCYLQNQNNSKPVNYVVTNLIVDHTNELWFSLYNKGLAKFNKVTNSIDKIFYFNEHVGNHSANISSIVEIEPGILCIGLPSQCPDNSLIVFDTNKEVSYSFSEYYNIEIDPFINVYSLFKEHETENMLIVSNSGIRYFDAKNQTMKKLFYEQDFGILYGAIIDKNKNIWVGTPKGIYFINEDHIETKIDIDGMKLTSSDVLNILEDQEGNIWFTTANELIKIPHHQIGQKHIDFQVYNANDELQFGEFKKNASLVSGTGRIFLGGNDGFNHFDPKSIQINDQIPDVIITEMYINNIRQLPTSDQNVLETNIKNTKQLKLNYKQTNIKLVFACLNFILPQKNEFACMMEGLEDEWTFLGNTSEIAYYKLPIGKYTFRVKASNNSDIWNNDGVVLKIEVLPPWWKSKWLYGLVALLVFFGFLMFYKIKTQNIKKRNIYLEEKISQKTKDLVCLNDELNQRNHEISKRNQQVEALAKQLSETNEQKLRLFTNISHEFRTPLSLILNSIDDVKLVEKMSDHQKRNIQIISKNVTRLKILVDQIIDLRRIEQKVMKLQISECNLKDIIENVLSLFNDVIEQRGIIVKLCLKQTNQKTYLDRNKIENVLINLLSNSLKHSSTGGLIEITLDYHKKEQICIAGIKVKDNGEGILAKDLPFVFDRFYSVSRNKGGGIGIGLSFCKEQVELHKGTIEVKSVENQETEFYLEIPVSKDYLRTFGDVETVVEPTETSHVKEYISDLDHEIEIDQEINGETNCMRDNALPVLLIVEDHTGLRKNLVKNIFDLGNIYEAENGLKGLQLTETLIPDIIISDVLMPGLDGITMCEQIKSNKVTNHIPIILLTAKTDDDSVLEGLSKGADDYLTKPFNMNILRQKITNILKSRETTMHELSKSKAIKSETWSDTSTNQKYINYLSRVIEEHLHDADFTVEHLGDILNMDRFQLYRKINSISGLSPSKFIIRIRLLKALELLKEKKSTVSEVAYDVGFNSSSYFAKCFKEAFGVQPSKYPEIYKERRL